MVGKIENHILFQNSVCPTRALRYFLSPIRQFHMHMVVMSFEDNFNPLQLQLWSYKGRPRIEGAMTNFSSHGQRGPISDFQPAFLFLPFKFFSFSHFFQDFFLSFAPLFCPRLWALWHVLSEKRLFPSVPKVCPKMDQSRARGRMKCEKTFGAYSWNPSLSGTRDDRVFQPQTKSGTLMP